MRFARQPIVFLLTLSLFGCGGGGSEKVRLDGAPSGYPDLSHTPDAIPRVEKVSRANQKPYTIFGQRYYPMANAGGYVEQGVASWYGKAFHGNSTANGERYDMYAMSAAHKTLPLPSYVQVRNLQNGRNIVVRVNDRGPFHDNRLIDLSYAAASKLGMLGTGTALVEVRSINPNAPTQLALKSTPVTPVSAQPRIYLQVGAFGEQQNALNLQQRLRGELKRPVRIEQVAHNGASLHRVQIGPLASIDIADQVSTQLAALQIVRVQVVVR